ncbi:MAG TPA: IS630 family transposase [Bacteroidales bacterium]|nr:IS630 family transposase [Bacteroidales bacterium]
MESKKVRFEKVNLFFQDESRFGLFTRNGKALTAKAVKPIIPFHQVFKSLYLYGAFSPINGDGFLLELPACNADLFQLFLNEFSLQNPDELKLIVLDNGAFHKAQKLAIPENIVLIFLPPYSPELNPAEKIWAKFKRDFTNRLFHTLDSLEKYLCELSSSLQRSEVISITSFSYVFSCPL